MKLLSDILHHLYKAGWFEPVRPERDFFDNLDSRRINSAFLIALAGKQQKSYADAVRLLTSRSGYSNAAAFYQEALSRISAEIEDLERSDAGFKNKLQGLAGWCAQSVNLSDRDTTQDKIWSVFFPEAQGIRGNEDKLVQKMRQKRKIRLKRNTGRKGIDPASQLLFTSNVLLAPPVSRTNEKLHLSQYMNKAVHSVMREKQKFWYDHPIPVGINPARNEFIYGMQGLDQALEFEKKRGNLPADKHVPCVLSASVTHQGLHSLAREYLLDSLKENGRLNHLDLFVFTETDCRKIIDEILVPASSDLIPQENGASLFDMFGVDGEYGRHYSFLKAISAFWHVFIDPHIHATFKIDLDQVFPQEKLVKETGASMFEHFKTDLWGAKGQDEYGIDYDLGMIAGALVNQSDIEKSVFTPDVNFPAKKLIADESVFYSVLPQALSTQAEMMTRYIPGKEFDGVKTCIQRVHVTGGTNGILVESLFKFKPFTPSFIGRAEDQAYIISTFDSKSGRLAYVHKDGLIMRHDKNSFAQEAIQAAETGKLIGDYTRILLFSYYARLVANDFRDLKKFLDPFTGSFISAIPVTLTLLRLALRAGFLFSTDQTDKAEEFLNMGVERLSATLAFTSSDKATMDSTYAREKLGWDVYYRTLGHMKKLLAKKEPFAERIARRAREIVGNCHLRA